MLWYEGALNTWVPDAHLLGASVLSEEHGTREALLAAKNVCPEYGWFLVFD